MIAETMTTQPAVPVWQLNVLRVFYALIGFIMGSISLSQLINHGPEMPTLTGAAKALLAGLALLCLVGLRHPLKMLPMLLFEMVWKTIWIALIAYPVWVNGRMTEGIEGLFWECSPVFVMYLVMPWRYIWQQIVGTPGVRWR